MSWRKRTPAEIDQSIMNKDFTGGYNWWPWLWYMRKGYLLAFFGNLAAGWIGGISTFDPVNENPAWLSYGIVGFFGIFAPTLIAYMLRRDYNKLKKGQTS